MSHGFKPGDHVSVVAGRYAGAFAIVDSLVGQASLWCYVMTSADDGEYATLRASSVAC
jgi:hypothetical protein